MKLIFKIFIRETCPAFFAGLSRTIPTQSEGKYPAACCGIGFSRFLAGLWGSIPVILSLIVFLTFGNSPLQAQTTPDEQLAAQYYQNKEYDKAVVYYEKLFNKKPIPLYYNYYVNCLKETRDFKKAEKVIKKLIKQNPTSLNYMVDLGAIYKVSQEPGKAKDQFQQAIKQILPNQEQILSLGSAFVAIKEWDNAINTYLRGRKLLQGYYSFNFELADVYNAKGDSPSMINEYLDVLEINDSYLQSVQNALQTSFGYDADKQKNEILKTELLKRIQRSSDNSIFSELLIWMFIQQKDFDAAFAQAKALDKRKKEDGSRVMALALLAASGENYDLSIKAYQYVIAKGNQNDNYISAKMELLNTMYKKAIGLGNYNQTDLADLEKNYGETIAELGKTPNTIPLLKSLAHLQAFYLFKTSEAVALLEEAITVPQSNAIQQAECKLELGDIFLMTGEIWEASLKYSQVEKSFKHEPIGYEAKYRNAKIAYYTGDFKWAQAQLNILKAATAKLIANDALDLSLLITDNTGIDTNTVPLLMFATADLLSFQNKDDQALQKLDSIIILFPNHALADDILFKKSEIMLKKNNVEEAAKFLQNIIDIYSNDVLADNAMFKLAELNETRFHNKQKAMELYQEILLKFPGSLYTVEARKRFRELRGDVVN